MNRFIFDQDNIIVIIIGLINDQGIFLYDVTVMVAFKDISYAVTNLTEHQVVEYLTINGIKEHIMEAIAQW